MANWQGFALGPGGPGNDIEAVTLDEVDPAGFILYVEAAGDVAVTTLAGTEPGAVAVSDFSYYPCVVTEVKTTGTDATGLWKVKIA